MGKKFVDTDSDFTEKDLLNLEFNSKSKRIFKPVPKKTQPKKKPQ